MGQVINVTSLADQINEAASQYSVGGLQQFRAALHRKRPRTFKIFSKQTIFDHYAFHDGGRTELQFNVGLEESGSKRFWRHGVAFSFERSQTLPDPESLRPKVARFNSWVRTSGILLNGFKMWHWEGKGDDSRRSQDRSPGEIPDELVTAETFVFLGIRIPEAEVDVGRILQDFDALYPLYQFVESKTDLPQSAFGNQPTQKMLSKKPTVGGRDLPLKDEEDIERLQQELTVVGRRLHNKLTNLLRERLCDYTLLEGASADAMFDVLVKRFRGNDDLLIEAKSSIEASHVRMAVGQLFDYWYRLNGPTQAHLAVLLPKEPDEMIRQMLEWLGIGVLWFEDNRLTTNSNWLTHLAGD